MTEPPITFCRSKDRPSLLRSKTAFVFSEVLEFRLSLSPDFPLPFSILAPRFYLLGLRLRRGVHLCGYSFGENFDNPDL
jgi:hypothetical protein